MKPLILILLAAITAETQSLAGIAREERARRAQITGARVYTNIDAGNAVGPPAGASFVATEVTPAGGAAAEAAAAGQPTASSAAPAAQPAPASLADPAKEWNDRVQNVRMRIRELQDQETALQLEVNALNNQFFAPVTTQAARTRAQTSIAATQSKLLALRRELADTRTTLQQMETQGPPPAGPTSTRP